MVARRTRPKGRKRPDNIESRPAEAKAWFKAQLRPEKGPLKTRCYIWTRACIPKGYGLTTWNKQGTTAHRVAWLLFRGPIPDGMLVCHICDNPPCCNPGHLFLGSPQDNMDDMIVKERDRKRPLTGIDHPRAKLTDRDVADILLSLPYADSQTQVAEEFGVTVQLVHQIRTGKARTNVPRDEESLERLVWG